MLNILSNMLADRLLKRGAITSENKDICVYGFQLLISFLFSTSLVIFIGAMIGKIIETIVFLIVYILLRSYSGGYHAETYIACTVITVSVYLITIVFTTFVNVNLIAYTALYIIGVLLLALLAPIKNEHKKITKADAIKYKIISLILYSAFAVIGICLLSKHHIIGNAVFYTLCADLLNLFPNCMKCNKNKKN